MATSPFAVIRRFRLTLMLVGVVTFVGIGILGFSVTREVQQLDRRENDSAQWTLSQAEIEILEFLRTLSSDEPELDQVRLRFDVLFSRVTTLAKARVFAELRNSEEFQGQINNIEAFLAQTVPLIDGPDAALQQAIPDIAKLAAEARRNARQLAIIGLQIFTERADAQRNEIVATTIQLAAAIVALIAGLAIALFYLDRTNKRAAARGRAVQRSATRMNTIIDTALDAVIVADDAQRIIEFNPAAEAIFGLSHGEAMNATLSDFIVDPRRDESPANKPSTVAKIIAKPGRVNGFAKHANGTTFPAEFAFQSADIPGENILIVFIRDISRRVAAEAELVAARDAALANERVKSEFLATMSHEIRTPLNGLLGNMDLLRDTTLSEPQQRYVKNMETSGRMLRRHITDVLDITQYDRGKMGLVERRIHLPTLMEDILATQSGLAASQHTSLEWRWDGNQLDWVSVDQDRLQHILMNLIGNAVKFTKNGAVSVLVSPYQQDRASYLRFQVSDTGIGIASDLLPRIFDDFVTGSTAYDRNVDGTGLGLSIAKRFTEGLGGTLRAESTLGEGSTFVLDLPVQAATAPDMPAMRRTLLPVSSQRVLVVEDNEINRTVVREMLEADGHRVTEASDGAQGVKLANQAAFDVILMDISMPELDGREAAARIIKGSGPSQLTPIVALTANALKEDSIRFAEVGMVTTITKPIARAALREVIREIAARPAALALPIIDQDHLSDTRQVLGDAAFANIHTRFATEIDALCATVSGAAVVACVEVAERAHQSAGSAATFGASRLQHILIELEEAANAGNDMRLRLLSRYLKATWDSTQSALSDKSRERTID